MKTLRLCFSPCPNDTFIFHGLVSGRVPLPGFALEPLLADVEVLNGLAAEGRADVCKVSAAAAAGLLDHWLLLRAGGALGRGVGPLLVAREPRTIQSLDRVRVAIPGARTTGNLLFGLVCKEAGIAAQRVELVFDQVLPAVARGQVDAGVVIHEGRFVYESMGLHCLADLGEWWESRRNLPLPLGLIAVRRGLGLDTARAVNRAIRASLESARDEAPGLWDYVRAHAQEMDQSVIERHIATFVTHFSLDVGAEGEEAVAALLAEARPGVLPEPLFLPLDQA